MYKCIVLSLFKVSEVTFNDIHCTSRTQIFCIWLYMCFNALRVLHIRRTRTKSDDSVHVHKSNIKKNRVADILSRKIMFFFSKKKRLISFI